MEIRGIPERDWEERDEREEGGRSGGEGRRVAGRVVGARVVVILGALKWPEPVGERRGFPKVGLVFVFLSTHVGTVGSLERP